MEQQQQQQQQQPARALPPHLACSSSERVGRATARRQPLRKAAHGIHTHRRPITGSGAVRPRQREPGNHRDDRLTANNPGVRKPKLPPSASGVIRPAVIDPSFEAYRGSATVQEQLQARAAFAAAERLLGIGGNVRHGEKRMVGRYEGGRHG